MKYQPIPRKELLLILLLAPLLGLILGGIYAYPAMKLTKEREPWLTLSLGAGLGVTVFGLGWVCHTYLPLLWMLWAASLLILLLVRALFGLRGNLEHFGMVHVATLLLVVLVASIAQLGLKKSAVHASQSAERGSAPLPARAAVISHRDQG